MKEPKFKSSACFKRKFSRMGKFKDQQRRIKYE